MVPVSNPVAIDFVRHHVPMHIVSVEFSFVNVSSLLSSIVLEALGPEIFCLLPVLLLLTQLAVYGAVFSYRGGNLIMKGV